MDEDKYRREKIDMELICDCYNDEEIFRGWESYMDEKIVYPFEAKIIKASSSKIPVGGIVLVTYVDCIDLFGTVDWLKDSSHTIDDVEVQWNDEGYYVNIEDLEPVNKNISTIEAIKDWNFWLEKY